MTRRFVRSADGLGPAARAYADRLDRMRGGRPLAVWGAGRAGQLAVQLMCGIERLPTVVVDSDPGRHGTTVEGVPVVGLDRLDAASAKRDFFVLLASMHAPEMAVWLETRGWQRDRDFATSPIGSIYTPALGFVLDGLPPRARHARLARDRRRPADRPEVSVFASAAGNFYFRELQRFLVAGLRHAGWNVSAHDEHASGSTGLPIVVGPHEFFSVGRGVDWLSAGNLASAVLLTTEQPQSLWFQAFAPAVDLAGAVVDLNPTAATLLEARGLPARWLPLGWFPGCDPFDTVPAGLLGPAGADVPLVAGRLPLPDEDDWDTRPIDVLFIGSHSPRRERWLSGLRQALPQCRWHVHLPSDQRPIPGGPVETATAVALARQAKILVNLHRDDTVYFEWQRVVWRGLWQRTLVVTERAGVVPGLDAGRHYIETPVEQMAAALRALLTTAAGRARGDAIRRAGWAQATGLGFDRTAAVLADALADVLAADGAATYVTR